MQDSPSRRYSGRVVIVWVGAAMLCSARLVQLFYMIIEGNENGPAYCKPEQRGEVVLTLDARNYSEMTSVPLHEFLEGHGLNNRLHHYNDDTNASAVEVATCQWLPSKWKSQFSHHMEQIYSCWSYWQQFPNATWVLYRPPTNHHGTLRGRERQNHDIRFVDGLAEVLEDFVVVTSDSRVLENAVRVRPGSRPFSMASPRDARKLAEVMRKSLDLPLVLEGNLTYRGPRIAILNRRASQKRTLLNAEKLAKRIARNVLQGEHSDESMNSTNVDVVYFEDKPFREQIEFFMQHDIIISPHGAQLTGIAFLPECSAVLEIFPDNFQNERYYGSLAEAAGLGHYSFRTGERKPPTLTISQRQTRIDSEVQLCPSRKAIIEGVERMVDDWIECRRRVELQAYEIETSYRD